jgi:hypothetical protein
MRRLTRRQALTAGCATCASLLAGCSSEASTYPDEPSGPLHLTLKNCTASEEGVDVVLTVRSLASETVVHDATHTVPDGYCSDMGSSYSIYEVWDGAGQYRVHAEAPATGASLTLPLELADTESDNPGAALRLVVSGGEFDVFLSEQTRRLDTNSSFRG